jgi:hypothetical protein
MSDRDNRKFIGTRSGNRSEDQKTSASKKRFNQNPLERLKISVHSSRIHHQDRQKYFCAKRHVDPNTKAIPYNEIAFVLTNFRTAIN